jgi:tRNA dimethylallyltransferase
MCLCLIGPTASGKSALAMALAESGALGRIEIVSLDSAQVYRHMNIGTAKPSAQEQQVVAHHVIDCRDPEESYSVAAYLREADAAIEAIKKRGNTPLVVGGTMLYFKAFRDGIDELPEVPIAIRHEIAQRAAQSGWPALHDELNQVDPATAQRLAPQDAQRISRALEVWQHTGRPISDFYRGRLSGRRLRVIALQPEDRQWVHQRIAARFDQMLQQGFLKEVAALRARPGLRPEMPSMRTVGYRQAWAHLAGETDFLTFCQQGIAATRQLAKRQITWLRSFGAIDRIDPSRLTPTEQLCAVQKLWVDHQGKPRN